MYPSQIRVVPSELAVDDLQRPATQQGEAEVVVAEGSAAVAIQAIPLEHGVGDEPVPGARRFEGRGDGELVVPAGPQPDTGLALFWIKFAGVYDAAFAVAGMWIFELVIIE